MKINGNIKKYSAAAIVGGSIIAIVVFSFAFGIFNLPFGNNGTTENPPAVIGIGGKIAARMEANEGNIAYLWNYNNTFCNYNLSNLFDAYIDGFRVGTSGENATLALIHEPAAEMATVNRTDLNTALAGFSNVISKINDTSIEVGEIDDMWPPDFLIDVAYEDNTSLSLAFSRNNKVLGVINGTWSLTGNFHFGIETLNYNYNYDDMVFLKLDDIQPFLNAISTFQDFIYDAYN